MTTELTAMHAIYNHLNSNRTLHNGTDLAQITDVQYLINKLSDLIDQQLILTNPKSEFLNDCLQYTAQIIRQILNKSDIQPELVELLALYQHKNSDYGDSFAQSLNKFGGIAYFVRLNDKINRLKTLTQPNYHQQVKDEQIIDTLYDALNYTAMAMAYFYY